LILSLVGKNNKFFFFWCATNGGKKLKKDLLLNFNSQAECGSGIAHYVWIAE